MKNKITFIYAYENEVWSTPKSLMVEFESRGWEVDVVSIGSNRLRNWNAIELKNWIESNPTTDIVLHMDWGRFNSPLLNKKYVDAFWIQESGDDPQNLERNILKSDGFHLILSPDIDSVNIYNNRGYESRWWTHFADTRTQYPIETPPEYVAVTTRGLGGSSFLDTITHHSNGSIGNRNNMEAEEHTKFLNKGLMVLQKSRWGEITRIIFEGMACGKLVITDRLNPSKKLEELFTDGEDIVFYDDITDCINKINKYKKDIDERNRISKNGYNKVIQNHTQTNRVEFILNEYNKWKTGKKN